MHSLGKRIQLGATPSEGSISQSSQVSGEFHKLVVSGAAPETATIFQFTARQFASMQQPADFFCKEFLSGQHRREDPISLLA